MRTAVLEYFQSVKVDSFPERDVIVVSSNETPIQGFEKLLKNNILSAPVFDVTTQQYIGFLDVRDLVSYAVFAYHNHNTIAYQGLSQGPIFHTLVDDVTVTYLARRNPFRSVPIGSSLFEVAKMLKDGVHRVPVVDSTGAVVKIISQSSVIQALQHMSGLLKEEVSKTVEELGLGTSPVVCVSKDMLAIDTFKLMDNTKKTAVALVDEQGKLVGNTSAKDLKLFIGSSCSYDILKKNIMSFLNQIRDENIDIPIPAISCTFKCPISLVIAKLAATKVHRLYVVPNEHDSTPVRVVSLTDILRYLFKEAA